MCWDAKVGVQGLEEGDCSSGVWGSGLRVGAGKRGPYPWGGGGGVGGLGTGTCTGLFEMPIDGKYRAFREAQIFGSSFHLQVHGFSRKANATCHSGDGQPDATEGKLRGIPLIWSGPKHQASTQMWLGRCQIWSNPSGGLLNLRILRGP